MATFENKYSNANTQALAKQGLRKTAAKNQSSRGTTSRSEMKNARSNAVQKNGNKAAAASAASAGINAATIPDDRANQISETMAQAGQGSDNNFLGTIGNGLGGLLRSVNEGYHGALNTAGGAIDDAFDNGVGDLGKALNMKDEDVKFLQNAFSGEDVGNALGTGAQLATTLLPGGVPAKVIGGALGAVASSNELANALQGTNEFGEELDPLQRAAAAASGIGSTALGALGGGALDKGNKAIKGNDVLSEITDLSRKGGANAAKADSQQSIIEALANSIRDSKAGGDKTVLKTVQDALENSKGLAKKTADSTGEDLIQAIKGAEPLDKVDSRTVQEAIRRGLIDPKKEGKGISDLLTEAGRDPEVLAKTAKDFKKIPGLGNVGENAMSGVAGAGLGLGNATAAYLGNGGSLGDLSSSDNMNMGLGSIVPAIVMGGLMHNNAMRGANPLGSGMSSNIPMAAIPAMVGQNAGSTRYSMNGEDVDTSNLNLSNLFGGKALSNDEIKAMMSQLGQKPTQQKEE